MCGKEIRRGLVVTRRHAAAAVCLTPVLRGFFCYVQVVFDYPNKRIGWKVPPAGALAQLQQQEQQHSDRQ
jgi:hypothetical protein